MDYKIVIDPGHGGDDPGAIGNEITEKDLTLKISQIMYNKFKELGIPVSITRINDESLSPSERVSKILNFYGNNENVIVLSNHINAGGGDGAEVIYALRNNNKLSNLILDNLEKEGQNVRKVYQRRLPSDSSKDYYFIHRETGKTQPVIIEYGFLDSTKDDVNQLKDNYKEFANAVVNAIVEYINDNSTVTYTVKSGDSLYSIANKFNTTVDKIKSLNNLSSNLLSIGQVLKIPKSESIEEEIIENNNTYIVKSGDSLYSIANKFNTTVDKIKSLNNLSSNLLSIGQVLKIPNVSNNNINESYVVQKGDNLYSIANKFNTTVDKIKSLNNLSSNTLSIGQILKIPSTASNNITKSYVVQKGDSLYSIANKFNTTVDKIKSLNNLSSNLLSIGQILKI